jgi:hypothetical protein
MQTHLEGEADERQGCNLTHRMSETVHLLEERTQLILVIMV